MGWDWTKGASMGELAPPPTQRKPALPPDIAGMIMPTPQPGIVPMPPPQFRPQPPPPANPMQAQTPPKPAGFREMPSPYSDEPVGAGVMPSQGPGTPQQAVQGLLGGGSDHPLLQLQRQTGEFRQQGNAGGLASAVAGHNTADRFDSFAQGQLAPDRSTDSLIKTAISSLHPGVQRSADLDAQRKALPNAAYAQGLTEQADITAEGALQREMISSRQDDVNSLRQSLGPALQSLQDLDSSGYDATPQSDQTRQILISIIQRMIEAGAL